MDIEAIRQHCLQFPHTTENVQWGADLCFKVDGKMFAVVAMETVPQRISFKCTAENFTALCERSNIIPAPYMARAQWVSLERLDALADAELREALAESYRLVWQRLPRKRRLELEALAAGTAGPATATQPKATIARKRGRAKGTNSGKRG